MPNTPAEIRFSLAPLPLLAEVEALWRKVDASGDSFFVSWTWIGTWLRCLPDRVAPLLLTGLREGEPIGAAILVPRKERRRAVLNVHQYHFNTTGDPELDCIWIEHNGFTGGEQANRVLWPAFLRWFARLADADELLVPGIVEGLLREAPGDAKLLHTSRLSQAFASDLPQGDIDTVLAGLSRNAREQCRRSLRGAEALGAPRCERAETVETALDWFQRLKELHIESWTERGKPHAFRYPFFEQFHRALIGAGMSAGAIQLLRISAGDARLGYLYNLRRGDSVAAYQSGFNETQRELRPGYLSHLLAMAWSAGEGARYYDFLAGDNQLKRTLGHAQYGMGWHRFGRPGLALSLEYGARAFTRAVISRD